MAQLLECYLGSKGRKFETHLRHCLVSFSKAIYPLLSTGLTQEDRKQLVPTTYIFTENLNKKMVIWATILIIVQ